MTLLGKILKIYPKTNNVKSQVFYLVFKVRVSNFLFHQTCTPSFEYPRIVTYSLQVLDFCWCSFYHCEFSPSSSTLGPIKNNTCALLNLSTVTFVLRSCILSTGLTSLSNFPGPWELLMNFTSIDFVTTTRLWTKKGPGGRPSEVLSWWCQKACSDSGALSISLQFMLGNCTWLASSLGFFLFSLSLQRIVHPHSTNFYRSLFGISKSFIPNKR